MWNAISLVQDLNSCGRVHSYDDNNYTTGILYDSNAYTTNASFSQTLHTTRMQHKVNFKRSLIGLNSDLFPKTGFHTKVKEPIYLTIYS